MAQIEMATKFCANTERKNGTDAERILECGNWLPLWFCGKSGEQSPHSKKKLRQYKPEKWHQCTSLCRCRQKFLRQYRERKWKEQNLYEFSTKLNTDERGCGGLTRIIRIHPPDSPNSRSMLRRKMAALQK